MRVRKGKLNRKRRKQIRKIYNQFDHNVINDLDSGIIRKLDLRQCPGCKVWIEKIGGCENMRCLCGCKFIHTGRKSEHYFLFCILAVILWVIFACMDYYFQNIPMIISRM